MSVIDNNGSNCLKKSSKSFKNIEKRKGNKCSTCRTPVRQGKNSD
jgi:ferredoxin